MKTETKHTPIDFIIEELSEKHPDLSLIMSWAIDVRNSHDKLTRDNAVMLEALQAVIEWDGGNAAQLQSRARAAIAQAQGKD